MRDLTLRTLGERDLILRTLGERDLTHHTPGGTGHTRPTTGVAVAAHIRDHALHTTVGHQSVGAHGTIILRMIGTIEGADTAATPPMIGTTEGADTGATLAAIHQGRGAIHAVSRLGRGELQGEATRAAIRPGQQRAQ